MSRIRVLIIDDSVVIRRMLVRSLEVDSEIEVVGVAADGRIALAKIAQLHPDVVTLDIEMPVMDGLTTLTELRKIHPRLPVIMFSTLTERGATSTLDALARGANDYVTKPSNVGSIAAGLAQISGELIPRIKALAHRQAFHTASQPPAPRPKPQPRVINHHAPTGIDILAIGTSTGGPNALAALLPHLTHPFPVPIVVVQHMPPLFTRLLAERLAATAGIIAREGYDGAPLKPGVLWLAPGGLHMEIEQTPDGPVLRLNNQPPVNSCRPAVDPLFQSVARVFGARTLAVVLTGMGSDGLHGCQEIHDAGGQIIVQDEASSVVWGMPGAVYHAGLAQKTLPLHDLATEINLRAGTFAPVAPTTPGPELTPASTVT